jgi:hypothetical protein
MPSKSDPLNHVLWIVPEKTGGIRTYAEGLLRALIGSKDTDVKAVWELPEVALFAPGDVGQDIVHLHHEFGFFGLKLPGRYQFPPCE